MDKHYTEDEVREIIDTFLPYVQSLHFGSMAYFDMIFWPHFREGNILPEHHSKKLESADRPVPAKPY